MADVLSSSKWFKSFTSSQRIWFENLLYTKDIEAGENLIVEGTVPTAIYIVRKGEIEVSQNGVHLITLDKGDFVGSVYNVYNEKESIYTFQTVGKVKLYKIRKDGLIWFFQKNPGLIMKLHFGG